MRRNKFSLSNYKLMTMDMGILTPINWYEVLPGDTFQQRTSLLMRLNPQVAPVMHPVRARVHHWFVPNRLLWDEWEDFITGGEDGTSTPAHPKLSIGSVLEHSLYDYMGVPVGTHSPAIEINSLPFRALALIWNEHYRDQDLDTEKTISKASGVQSDYPGTMYCSWEKDYFTTCRPSPQKGPDVTIPLGDSADVVSTGDGVPSFVQPHASSPGALKMNSGSSAVAGSASATSTADLSWSDPKLEADLSGATGIDLEDLRLALAIQRFQEARSQYGSRYVEYLRYLGVRSSDARLQSPEYLGGGSQTVQFSEVVQTAEGTDPVGSLAGHGIAALRTNRYRRFFEEHGIVLSVLSVIPKSIYVNGLHRSFSREVKEDYFTKELQAIGDQEVYNKECNAFNTNPDDIFGYQRRYDEYRSMPSRIAGRFNSTMASWHFGRIFSGDVALNSTFTRCSASKRPFADTTNVPLNVMVSNSIQARRMMSKTGTPRTI